VEATTAGVISQDNTGDAKPAKEDWEDEQSTEEAALQALVDKLHDKGEKEISRILKVSIWLASILPLLIRISPDNRVR
jgi:hypothetical protein